MSATQYIQSDGHSIAVDVTGAGPAVLLLSGLLMNRQRWHETGYVERLAERRTVITMDPLGHGESSRPHEPSAYRPEALSDHIAAVLDANDTETCDLWGYSRGGQLVANFAFRHPDRVSTLIIGGTPVGVPPGFIGSEDQLAALRGADWAEFWRLFPAPLPSTVKDYMQRTNDPAAIAAVLEAGNAGLVEWRPVTSPALLYLGDGEVFAEFSGGVARSIGLATAILPTGGHAETFADVDACCGLVEPFLTPAS